MKTCKVPLTFLIRMNQHFDIYLVEWLFWNEQLKLMIFIAATKIQVWSKKKLPKKIEILTKRLCSCVVKAVWSACPRSPRLGWRSSTSGSFWEPWILCPTIISMEKSTPNVGWNNELKWLKWLKYWWIFEMIEILVNIDIDDEILWWNILIVEYIDDWNLIMDVRMYHCST